jgi:hypothetical protein
MGISIWRGVRAELRRILLSISGVPDLAYELGEGVIAGAYHPTVGIPWIREAIEKGPSVTRTLGSYGMTEEQGILLIDLYWPKTGVKADGEDLADKIRLSFWHGREIGAAGPDFIKGRVISSESRRTVVGDIWVVFPIRITFFIDRMTRQT